MPEPSPSILPTGTVTFLFTDIEGSTHLWTQFPSAMPAALAQHNHILTQSITSHHGYIFQIIGDAFCAAFHVAQDAINAAISAQRGLRNASWGETGPVLVRMALHTGTVEVNIGEYTSGEYASGLTLSQTSRLLYAGHGGQVLLSLPTAELTRDHLPAEAVLVDHGEHRLKGLPRPEHIFQLTVPDLPADFPALKTLDIHPNNLPVDITRFIGREREISEAKSLLITSRLVTLTGMGGVGKTRLALQIAADLVGEYPHGIWLVELAAISNPSLVPQAVVTVLKIRHHSHQPLTEQISEFAHDKCLLLLIDNCEHLIDACAKFCQHILRSTLNVRLLATSREALNIPGEQLYAVPSLAIPPDFHHPSTEADLVELAQNDAVRLFIERAMAIQPSFSLNPANGMFISQVCQRLDGIPLAIELAAARVRTLSVEQINTRLNNRFQLLTSGSRTNLPRQQTLQALIDWSYDLLSPQEQSLFRRLVVFKGNWTLGAAEKICSPPDGTRSQPEAGDIHQGDILELLSRLVDKSLVISEEHGGEMYYRMLETIRQYASLKIHATGELNLLCQRHYDYYLNTLQAYLPSLFNAKFEEVNKRFQSELDNYRAAMEWALESQNAEAALELAYALHWFFFNLGYLNEERQLLEQSLSLDSRQTAIRGRCLCCLATILFQQGSYSLAQQYIQESIAIWRSLNLDDEDGLANAIHIYGHILFDQQDYLSAQEYFTESLALYQQLNDMGYYYILIGDLGMVSFHLGDYPAARLHFEDAVNHLRRQGSIAGVTEMLNRLGEINRIEGLVDQALNCYTESLEIARSIDSKLDTASALHKLGYIYLRQDDLPQAKKLFIDSLSMQREMGNRQGISECLVGLGSLECSQGNYFNAVRFFSSAQALLNDTGAPLSPADRLEFDNDLAKSRAGLTQVAFDQAWETGRGLSLDELLASQETILQQ